MKKFYFEDDSYILSLNEGMFSLHDKTKKLLSQQDASRMEKEPPQATYVLLSMMFMSMAEAVK